MNAPQALRYVSEERPVQVSFDEGKKWSDLSPIGMQVVGSTGLGVFNSNTLDLLQFRLKPSPDGTTMPRAFDRHTIPINAWYRDPASSNMPRRITSFDDDRVAFDRGFITYNGLHILGWEYSEDGRTNWNPCHRKDA